MSPASPQVSVVMGVRDARDSVASSIDSVLGQVGVDLELLVVDDGSSDGTAEVAQQAAGGDPRVRILRSPGDGLTAALIHGCEQAQAPLIARQDAGDLSLPSRLRRQIEALARHPEVVLVSCFTECLAPGGEPLYEIRGAVEPDLPVPLIRRSEDGFTHVGPTAHGSAVFRRAAYLAVGGYRGEFALGQDWDLWLRLAERGGYLCVGSVLYRRVLAPGSLGFTMRDLQQAYGELSIEATRRRLEGRSDGPVLERAAALRERFEARRQRPGRSADAWGFYHLGETLRRRGDRAAAGYLRSAVARRPLLLRAWVRLAQAQAMGAGRARRLR